MSAGAFLSRTIRTSFIAAADGRLCHPARLEIKQQRLGPGIRDLNKFPVSAATLLETALVVEMRKGEAGGRELDLLMHKAEMTVVPVDVEQVSEARRAFGVSARDATPRG